MAGMRRVIAVSVVAALVLAAAAALTSAAPRTVHLRGTAYEFNNTSHRLGNATIRVAELPRIKVKTRANGTYDLVVPNRAKVTPYIQATGFHTIYLQTFTTAGANLANVNFQTPSDGDLPGACRAAQRPARPGRQPEALRDRLDVQHAQRAEPELRAVHRLRRARGGGRHRVDPAIPPEAHLLQRERRSRRPGAPHPRTAA